MWERPTTSRGRDQRRRRDRRRSVNSRGDRGGFPGRADDEGRAHHPTWSRHDRRHRHPCAATGRRERRRAGTRMDHRPGAHGRDARGACLHRRGGSGRHRRLRRDGGVPQRPGRADRGRVRHRGEPRLPAHQPLGRVGSASEVSDRLRERRFRGSRPHPQRRDRRRDHACGSGAAQRLRVGPRRCGDGGDRRSAAAGVHRPHRLPRLDRLRRAGRDVHLLRTRCGECAALRHRRVLARRVAGRPRRHGPGGVDDATSDPHGALRPGLRSGGLLRRSGTATHPPPPSRETTSTTVRRCCSPNGRPPAPELRLCRR